MICRLCLKGADDTMQIFEGRGLSLNIANVLSKYFWFQPKCDDPISTVICVNCWTQVNEFNVFYLAVEKAHRLLTERFSIKEESFEKLNNTSLNSNHQLNEQLHQNELLFDDEIDDVDADGVDSSAGAASFSNEQFLNDVLDNQESKMSFKDEEDLQDVPLSTFTERRTTRSSTKIKSNPAATTVATSQKPIKRRGRPKKGLEKAMEAPKNKRYADYKQSMLEIDQKISKHMRLTCDVCHEGQETFLLLCKHMMQSHRRKGYAVCCNKKFYKRSFLTDHIDRHNNPEKFKCDLCGKTFADKQCLRNHELLRHQPDEDKIFKCENCPKRYTRQYLLDQHRVIHKERTVPCEMCDRRFPNVSMLNTHIKLVHGNYGTMCDICAQVIRGRAAFQRHQLEHAGVTEPKVQCDICGSWHKNKYSLKKHVRRHNLASEECTCTMCGKVSPNRSAMLSHQRYVHLADRKFECSVCSKAFKKAITLKEHMTMHTGEVLYKCPHCPKTFNSNANKHSHRKKCHPKEFEEARKARNEGRMVNVDDSVPASNSSIVESKIITITTADGEEETHKILVTTEENSNDDLKGESIVFTLS